ncbi:DUF4352 domain-containing protein [Actinomadura monticuli]|uniref:DUF4352 domain-containing protein n=1 Tax=Actinomadura monticuli TaxID=3097367 RepID=A0ABV4Q679_9ACTN
MKRIAVIAFAVIILAATGCGTDEEGAQVQPSGSGKATGSEKPNAKRIPVKLSVKKTTFHAGALAEGDNYTSVRVTVTNRTGKVLDINPLFFAITDTSGTRHEADALGADDREIDTTKLQPNEKATGTVTSSGTYTPSKVTFTKDGFGTAYVAEVG